MRRPEMEPNSFLISPTSSKVLPIVERTLSTTLLSELDELSKSHSSFSISPLRSRIWRER